MSGLEIFAANGLETLSNITGENIRDKLLALSDATRGLLVTDPTTGEFRIISLQRKADGSTEIVHSDQAES